MRIAKVVRWAGYLLSVATILFAIAITYRDPWDLGGAVLTIVGAAFVAACGWTLAWIIEGFAKPKQ